jgi:phosphate uptake regulator
MNKLTLSAIALLMTLGLAGCSQDDEAVDLDEAGENVQEMADDAADAAEEMGEDIGDAAEDASDEVKDSYNEATE